MMQNSWRSLESTAKFTLQACLALFVLLVTGTHSESSEYVPGFLHGNSDPRLNGIPTLIQQPLESYYLIKNTPVEIICKATSATKIKYVCAGVQQEHEIYSQYYDDKTYKQVLVASLELTKTDVKAYYGGDDYLCHCIAYNMVLGTTELKSGASKQGIVHVAFLKKWFQREPISKKVALKSNAELQCLPPDGQPMPQVFWKKDNREIDIAKSNYLISSEGNLLFSQVRLSDMGNYSCGARNRATERISKPAELIVYINGSWSTWSQWSGCTAKCGKGVQRRSRSCSNPAPLNGGSTCGGPPMDRKACNSLCPVDGDWAQWSSWSTCSTNCLHHRRRSCDLPRPANGGVYCWGKDLDSTNCTGGMCRDFFRRVVSPGSHLDTVSQGQSGQPGQGSALDRDPMADGALGGRMKNFNSNRNVEPARQATTSDKTSNQNIALYIGICVSIAVLATAIVIIILVIRGRRQNQHPRGASIPIATEEEKKVNKNGNGVVPPDLTQTVVIVQNQPQMSRSSSMEPPNNNVSSVENIYDKPDFGSDHRLSGTMIKNGKAVFVEPMNSPSGNSHCDKSTMMVPPIPPGPRPTQMNNNNAMMDSRQSMMSAHLPSTIDIDYVAWGTFTHIGGRLVLPESGVAVTVPEGAIKKGQTEELYVAVCRDDKDRPKLSDRQTVISPVILCGPSIPGMLKKPVIISFQHCANMRQGGWMLSLCGSDSPPEEQPEWERLVTLGQENINTYIYAQLDPNHCHVMTDYLQRFALIGESVPGGKPVKILRLAAFAPSMPPSMDFSIRVYLVEDTQDALEGVIQEEKKFGGRLLDKPKQIPFQDGGHNLCLTIEELTPGWRSKLAANYQEIPFQHIWSGTQNNLHCSFSLELVDRNVNKISCKIQAYQKAILSNRQILNITNHFTDKSNSCSTPSSTLKGRSSTVTTNSSSGFSSMITLEPAGQNFRLPAHIKGQLCMLLDPPNARGTDWRMLAQALTVDRYIQYFATKHSPTEHILDLWEARHREESAITDLMNIFRVMGRLDAAAVLEKDMGSWL